MSQQFFKCSGFEFHTIASQPEAFINRLSSADRAKVQVACEGIANAFVDGSPQVRSRLVRGARTHDLFVIYVDWPSGPGSKTILLARRDANRVLVARGLESVDGQIPQPEVERAERALAEAESDDEEGGRR